MDVSGAARCGNGREIAMEVNEKDWEKYIAFVKEEAAGHCRHCGAYVNIYGMAKDGYDPLLRAEWDPPPTWKNPLKPEEGIVNKIRWWPPEGEAGETTPG